MCSETFQHVSSFLHATPPSACDKSEYMWFIQGGCLMRVHLNANVLWDFVRSLWLENTIKASREEVKFIWGNVVCNYEVKRQLKFKFGQPHCGRGLLYWLNQIVYHRCLTLVGKSGAGDFPGETKIAILAWFQSELDDLCPWFNLPGLDGGVGDVTSPGQCKLSWAPGMQLPRWAQAERLSGLELKFIGL